MSIRLSVPSQHSPVAGNRAEVLQVRSTALSSNCGQCLVDSEGAWLNTDLPYCYDREGTLKVGDRVLAANGVSLMQRTLSQALNFLRDVPDDDVSFLVEYDVSVLGQLIRRRGCTRK